MLDSGIRIIIDSLKIKQIETEQEIELLYLLEGELLVNSLHTNYIMRQNDVLIVNPGESCHLTSVKEGILCRLKVENRLFEDFTPNLKSKNYILECSSASALNIRDGSRYERLRHLLNELLYSYLQNNSQIGFMQVGLCYHVLDHVTQNFFAADTSLATSANEAKHDKRIVQVKKYVQENYYKQITLGELAQILYVTQSHLSRVIKKELGEGFREYLNRVRLRRAVEDLIRTNESVIRIANDNGFSGVTIFNKIFKEAYGITPSQFKKEQKTLETSKANDIASIKHKALQDTQAFLAQYNEKQSLRIKGVKTQVNIDASATSAYTRPWESTINVGTAAALLNYKTQDHVLKLKRLIDFSYIRLWGLFHEEMLVLPKEQDNSYNFSKVDDVINFLLINQIKPFFQLGPKPRLISKTVGEELLHEHNYVLYDYDTKHWRNLLDKLIAHFVSRYGRKEVETWVFEMWTPCRWDGKWYDWYTEDKYFAVYQTVKKYVPAALVGTGEFALCAHSVIISDIIEQWKLNNAVPDFVSYQGFPYHLDGDDAVNVKWITDQNFLRDMIDKAKSDLAKGDLAHVKLFITTWNLTISNRSMLNDTVFKGAYVIKNAIDTINNADLLSYWLCTDSYTEEYDSRELLFGGAGLLSKDGISKPSFYAFEFLNKLRSSFVKRGENFIVSAGRHGSYTIVYHNLKKLNYSVYLKRDSDFAYEDMSHIFEELEPLTLHFYLNNLKDEFYDIRMQTVSADYGSILDEWKRIGGFNELQTQDRDYLARVCIPKRDMLRKLAKNGKFDLEVTVQANAFGVIEIFPVEASN